MRFFVKNCVRLCIACVLSLSVVIAPAWAQPPVPRIKPAPPGPVYLSPVDYSTMELFFGALKSRKYSLANKYRQQVKDPVGRSVADWAWINADPTGLSYQETGVFLDSHFNWPHADRQQRNAEKAIPANAAPASVLAFFSQRNPISGRGKRAAAKALFTKGRKDEAAGFIRSAWIEHDWPSRDEKTFAANFGQYLSAEDHAAKADRQLFEVKASATKRLLPFLRGSERRKAAARIALLRRDANAVSLLNALTTEEKTDSGVLHAATRYYRRGDNEPTGIAYALQAPINELMIRNAERWWTERRLLMGWALKNGRYEDAYAMAAFSGLTEGGHFADAEFAAGWLALRFLNDPAKAIPHFAYLDAGVSAPISKARAQYWLGRAFAAQGETNRANQHFQVAAAYPFTYYGQLAYEQLAPNPTFDNAPHFPSLFEATPDETVLFNSRPLVHAMRILAELDQDRSFIIFARALDDQLQTSGEYVEYEKFMLEQNKVFLSVRAGKVAVKRGADAPQVSYPLIFVPEQAQNFAEHALILGLSRQESEFNPRAYSSARARGIMQLLASTAKITARKEGLPYNRARLLDDPNYNMVIGSAHLSHLLKRFDGSYIMTLVAYNAGPHRVTQWIDTYGDPRSPNVDPIDWVEMIPFSETRNYVMRVMENVQIYRARLYDQPIAGALSRDLVRGGGTVSAIGITPPSPILEIMSQQQRPLQMSSNNGALPPAAGTSVAVPIMPTTTPPLTDLASELATPILVPAPPQITSTQEPPAQATISRVPFIAEAQSENAITEALNRQMLMDLAKPGDALNEEIVIVEDCLTGPDQVSDINNADDLNNAALQDYILTGSDNC